MATGDTLKKACASCRTCPVYQNSLFADSEPQLLRTLEKKKSLVRVKKNGYLFRQGQKADGIYCIASGSFRIVQNDGSQHERVVRLLGPGGPAGHRSLFTSHQYRGSCQAKENAYACHIPHDLVLECLNSSVSFAQRLISHIAHDLIQIENEYHSNAPIPQRLTLLLNRLRKDFGVSTPSGESVLSVALTKVEIASLLSAAEETVVRAFTKLKRAGLVRFDGKKIVLAKEPGIESNKLG